MANDDAFVSIDDAAAIGFKIVEMADRARVGNSVIPGAKMEWGFTIDGVRYVATVAVAPDRERTG